jgi:hypothetical protein
MFIKGKAEMNIIAGTEKKPATVDGLASECSFCAIISLAIHEASHSCFVGQSDGAIRKIQFED